MGRISVLLAVYVVVVVVALLPFVCPSPVKPVVPPEDVVSNEKEMVEAAADHTSDKALSRPKRSASNRVSLQSLSGDVDKLRTDAAASRRKRNAKAGGRSKRQAMFDYDDMDVVEPSVEEELASLSDEELAALANIVRQELNAYESALAENVRDGDSDDAEVVVEPQAARLVPVVIEDYSNYDLNEPNDEPLFGRPRRSDPDASYAVLIPSAPQVIDDDDDDDSSRIVLVPETVDDEDDDDDDDENNELVDELELRSRIAELADILNERVASGY